MLFRRKLACARGRLRASYDREQEAEIVTVGTTKKYVEKGKWLAAGWNTWRDLDGQLFFMLLNSCKHWRAWFVLHFTVRIMSGIGNRSKFSLTALCLEMEGEKRGRVRVEGGQ